jgi:hypothetical protein
MKKNIVKIGLLELETIGKNKYIYSIKILEEYETSYKIEYGELLHSASGLVLPIHMLPTIIKKEHIYDIKEKKISWWQNLTNNYF